MIVNRESLLRLQPIRNMEGDKIRNAGVTHGLGEAGYDIRIKQDIIFDPDQSQVHSFDPFTGDQVFSAGRFILASAIEEFHLPPCLTGIVHDKSSWARQGLSVFNTVIEPGWAGFLTLELVYHGNTRLVIPSGAGIAQVIFHRVTDEAQYSGRYQNQADEPVAAIHAE